MNPPLRGIASDSSYLTGVLAGIPGPKVLVGHSYGGAIITQLASTPDIKALVYVGAFIPQAGETVGELNAKYPGASHLVMISEPTPVTKLIEKAASTH